jgi:uridine kinase
MENDALRRLIAAIEAKLNSDQSVVCVGIDGRCGAGKSTLAQILSGRLGASVIAMDGFFLPPELRTPERLAEGNAHVERFLAEVAPFLRSGAGFACRRFDCAAGDYAPEPVQVPPGVLRVVEGSYSLHPQLRHLYDVTVFCDAAPGEQRRRLLAREGPEGFARFEEKWVPLEEAYFARFKIREMANYVMQATA